jgi:hypothetical protein
MNTIKCIFDSNKVCDDCGECDRCDLDSHKTCDNCGKCLNIEKSDMRAVRVDEVVDNIDDALDYEDELKALDSDLQVGTADADEDDGEEGNEVWEYIDDVEGLNDLLNDKEKFEKYAEEEYPGLIKLRKLN